MNLAACLLEVVEEVKNMYIHDFLDLARKKQVESVNLKSFFGRLNHIFFAKLKTHLADYNIEEPIARVEIGDAVSKLQLTNSTLTARLSDDSIEVDFNGKVFETIYYDRKLGTIASTRFEGEFRSEQLDEWLDLFAR